ncbi:MAG: TIGR01244 family sulfur transferase [Pseudomonadota bacterium]
MPEITFITDTFAVTSALQPEDLPRLKAQGFKTIINNRPDGEAADQVPAHVMAQTAAGLQLHYTHVPSTKLELFCDETVEGMAKAISEATEPVLAHCQSGMRSAIIWAASEARQRPVGEVLADLEKAGFELDFLRDELDQQAAVPLSRSTVATAAEQATDPKESQAA